MKNQFLNVFNKERMDTLRDRRTVLAALSYAFIGPALLFVVLSYLANEAGDETATVFAIEGGQNAPNLVAFLEGEGVEIIPPQDGDTPWQKIGSASALAVIDENFQANLASGKRAKVAIYVDRTNNDFSNRANRISGLINSFGGRLGEARLLSLGVPPTISSPLQIETKDLSPAGARAKTISFLLIYFFVLAPFFSSLSVSIDTTAGERERKSLQSLLAQPVSTQDLIVGKWMIGALFGVAGTLITVVGGLTVMSYAPLELLGIKLNFGIEAQLSMLLSLIPLAFMVAALQILVSLSAKSYKEANTYLQLISFTPVIIGLTTSLSGKDIEGPLSYFPVISHLQNTQAALLEGGMDINMVLISGAISIGVGILCLILAAKRLGSETILSAA